MRSPLRCIQVAEEHHVAGRCDPKGASALGGQLATGKGTTHKARGNLTVAGGETKR